MRAVLGIDAAWTLTEPSGVALAVEQDGVWRLVAAAASYRRFEARADDSQPFEPRPSGSMPNAASLLAAAAALCGQPVDLIAIDMPLAQSAITGRRASDNAVSRAYGGRKCSTHSPNAIRPGRISDDLREGFGLAGYPLRTGGAEPPGLIEVYPHPALVELAGAPQRLPYKARKVRRYWPSITPAERRVRLLAQWAAIVAMLEDEITGVSAALPPLGPGERGAAVKAYEDALDAVICAWVGVCALQGRALPFGDDVSAIWIPVVEDPLRSSLA